MILELKRQKDGLCPQLGDRIEIDRGLYCHWALYAGDNKVIHMAGVGNETLQSGSEHAFTICGKLFEKAEVRIDDLRDVIKDSKVSINNSKDKDKEPYTGQEIIWRAKEHLGSKVKYSLITQNCEHFVNWCRYGDATSDQAQGLKIAAGVGLLGLAAGGKYLVDKNREKQEKLKMEKRKEKLIRFVLIVLFILLVYKLISM